MPRAVFILLLLFVVRAGAFSSSRTVLLRPTAPRLAFSPTTLPDSFVPPPQVGRTTTAITTALQAKKDLNKDDPVKKEMEWDFGLVLLFMNPLRNPNSIFVYMFLILFVLGKYSETH
jgi:hypothetical protein